MQRVVLGTFICLASFLQVLSIPLSIEQGTVLSNYQILIFNLLLFADILILGTLSPQVGFYPLVTEEKVKTLMMEDLSSSKGAEQEGNPDFSDSRHRGFSSAPGFISFPSILYDPS